MANVSKMTINNLNIPYVIRSYKTSKHIKIYFKDGMLKITKPTRVSKENAMKFVYENEKLVYENYLKSLYSLKGKIKQWKNGEEILYKGEQYTIFRKKDNRKNIKLYINEYERKFEIQVPDNISEEDLKRRVDALVKKQFKQKTEEMISTNLPCWSKKMKLDYSSFVIKDTIGRYGSCIPSKKALQFSSRLIMLPKEEVDAIIVHELAHILYKYHDKNFYNLVQKYLPNYKEIDRWLKDNSNQIYI